MLLFYCSVFLWLDILSDSVEWHFLPHVNHRRSPSGSPGSAAELDAKFLNLVSAVCAPRLFIHSLSVSDVSIRFRVGVFMFIPFPPSLHVSLFFLRMTLHASSASPIYLGAQRMPVRFDSTTLSDVLCAPDHLVKEIAANYMAETIVRAPLLLGSLDIFGNPTFVLGIFSLLLSLVFLNSIIFSYLLFIAESVSTGVSDLISLPRSAFASGAGTAAVVRAMGSGLSSLLRHVAEGTLASISGFSAAVSRNLERLSADEIFKLRKQVSPHSAALRA